MLSEQEPTDTNPSIIEHLQFMVDTIPGINYVIDREYKISLYSKEKWDAFAQQNSGDELISQKPIRGSSILDNFAGKKVKQHYKRIYDLIFEGKKTEVIIRSNCDAPAVLRDNVIFLTPIYQDLQNKDEVIGILHQSLMIKQENRKRVDLLDKSTLQRLEDNTIEICSICKKVRPKDSEDKEWMAVSTYEETFQTSDIAFEHTICDECSVMLNEYM